jgi:type IV secretory pathway TrbD component
VSESAEPEGWKIKIHQSAVRPKLVLGAERMPAIMCAALCALPAATGQFRYVAAGILAWIGILFVLRRAAKYDPILSDVFSRYVNFRPHHSAQPSIIAPAPPSPVQQRL